MAPPPRPPITCHVLDTVTGLPAASIPVKLSLIRPSGPSEPFTATTNADGRVTAWETQDQGPSLEELFANARDRGVERSVSGRNEEQRSKDQAVGERAGDMDMVWALTFDVGEYFRGQGFWTEVEVRFKTGIVAEGTEEGEAPARSHWHVPLLLSPWSYTTYRGS